MATQSDRDLIVWQKAMNVVIECNRATEAFPKSEVDGLAEQLQHTAVSIPAHIADDHGRHHLNERLHHLSIANGSLLEVETHLLMAGRLSYLDPTACDALLAKTGEIDCPLSGLAGALRRKS